MATGVYAGTHVKSAARSRAKPRGGKGKLVLFALLALAAVLLLRHLGGQSVRVPKGNIETNFSVELSTLPEKELYHKGGGSARAEDAEKLRALAEETPDWADKLNFIAENIGDFSNNGVKSVLSSPEKCDFVLRAAYGPRENTPGAALHVRKGTIPYLLQYDSRWAFTQYGSSYMGYTACGPTCLSMAAAGLTGKADYTPEYVADFAEKNGYYVDGAGTSWSLFTDGAEKLGLRCESVATDSGAMKKALRGGGVLIASMTQGDFTSAGHFIVIYKSGFGGFRVYDPSSVERSERVWSFDRLQGQIAQLWRFTAA